MLGDHQNFEKTIQKEFDFLGFGNQFFVIFLDFGGVRQFQTSKSASASNWTQYYNDTAMDGGRRFGGGDRESFRVYN